MNDLKTNFCKSAVNALIVVQNETFPNDMTIMHLIESHSQPSLLYACEYFHIARLPGYVERTTYRVCMSVGLYGSVCLLS